MADNEQRPIIKKVIKVEGGGHHGGAWKVAYSDFVTAMMAFFMLLWLLNVAPPETLAGLADYFSPTTAAVAGRTGADAVNSPSSDASGSNPSPMLTISELGPPLSGESDGKKQGNTEDGGGDPDFQNQRLAEMIRQREDDAFMSAQDQIQQAIQDSPQLNEHSDQIIMEITEDGMKIQLIDKDNRAMFRSGTADLYEYANAMLNAVGQSVQSLPNRLSILGHTDTGGFNAGGTYGNWELSADRANSARRAIYNSGVTEDRFSEVIGKAGTEPLYPDAPNRSENRRITMLVLREAPVVPPALISE